jgi:hypothetical protein
MKASFAVGLFAAFAAIAFMMSSSSLTGNAFAHAHMTLTPDIENVNPISVIIGHTNEPTYGAKAGIHDGKHGLEVMLEDADTALPLTGAQLKADKYYFVDMNSFSSATSLEQADQIEKNVTVAAVFGDPGHYMARQVMQPGIYGYKIYGTVSYFGIAEVPIDTVVFCNIGSSGNTSKFNSEGWSGSFGCTENINDEYFPPRANMRLTTDSEESQEQVQQVALTGSSSTAAIATQGSIASLPALQILAVGATAAVGGFFGLRAFMGHHKRDEGL